MIPSIVEGPKPIAIIGMACRLPAGASNAEGLWTTLANGQSGWTSHPGDRTVPDIYYHPNPDKKGCFNSKGGHYVEEDIARFDAKFFNMSVAEAIAMDPQQRQLLEVSYEALENAGIPLSSIAGTDVGVFVGGSNADYRYLFHNDMDTLPIFECTGNGAALLSNRISYSFNLRGPSMTIDTACSSSLIALHTAFRSLQVGESSSAIVGGSNLHITSNSYVSLSTMRLLSPDGRSYSFDDRAINGYGRGEGTSCIILKPLDAALRDRDPIRAVIRNTGTNQDGKTAGITMPNGEAQTALIRSCYEAVGLNPLDTDYVEAHGTGTAVGDPIEVTALGEVFGREPSQSPVYIGSIKSNVGHLEGTSGVCSIIKSALMLERKFLIPNCDFQQPNRNIAFGKWNMRVASKFIPWESHGIRRASCNNCGFGGSNSHVIMEEAVLSEKQRSPKREYELVQDHDQSNDLVHSVGVPPANQYLYIFSANDRESLERQVTSITAYVKARPMNLYPDLLESLAFTLGQRRSVLSWNVAITASTPDAMIQNLSDATTSMSKATEMPRIGFVFTGQGSQWAQMGKELFHTYPTYARTIAEADRALTSLSADWSLIDEMHKPQRISNIDRPYISQPACTALQIALVDLLTSWGITPKSVTGHSSGEIAAAYAAGILDLKASMKVAHYRGVVATKLRENRGDLRGAMLAIGATQDETQAVIDASVGERVVVACINSTSSITVSGDEAAIDLIQDLAEKKSMWNRKLKVDVAYHSHHMDRIADDYESLLGEVHPNVETAVEFFSSLKGTKVESRSLNTSYWVRNLTSKVRFSEAVSRLCGLEDDPNDRRVDMLVEIGPHSALQGPVRQILQTLKGNSRDIQYGPSLLRNEDGLAAMLRLSARLFSNGCQMNIGAVNFPNLDMQIPKILTDLPPYHWNHSKRYWHETRLTQEMQTARSQRHDLLGTRVPSSSLLEPQWRSVLTSDEVPWLRDHRVQGLTVFPMAGYLCMAVEACRQQAAWKDVNPDLIMFREITVHQALSIPDTGSVELRLSLVPFSEGTRSSSDKWNQFRVFSWTSDRGWLEHCRGLLASGSTPRMNPLEDSKREDSRLQAFSNELARYQSLASIPLASIPLDSLTLYRVVADADFEYGPTFRHIEKVTFGPSNAVHQANVPDTAALMPMNYESHYTIHPVTLDLVFHGIWPLMTNGGKGLDVPYMPIAIGEMTISTKLPSGPGAGFQVYTQRKHADKFSRKGVFDIDAVDLRRSSPTPCISIKNFVGAAVHDSYDKAIDQRERCLRIKWEPSVVFLDRSHYNGIFSLSPADPSTIHELWTLERLSFSYIKDTVCQVLPGSIAAPHLRKLFSWMERQVRLLREGQNAKLGPDFIDMPDAERRLLRESAKSTGAGAVLIHRIGESLSGILQGEIEPLSIMLEDNLLTRYYADSDSHHRRYALAAKYVGLLAHQNPGLRIIEVGGGSAGATVPLLEILGGNAGVPAKFARYDFTDVSTELFEPAKAKLSPWGQLVKLKQLNIEHTPVKQGFQAEYYDLVVASDVLHATADMQSTMKNLRSLLKAGGSLLLMEETGCGKLVRMLPFATLPGWWPSEVGDDQNGISGAIRREDGPTLVEEQWDSLLKASGFNGLDGAAQDYPEHPEQATSVMFATASLPQVQNPQLDIIVVGQDIPGTLSRTELESPLKALGSVTWIDFSALPEMELFGKYCILLDNPTHQYLTTMTAISFRGLQRLAQALGVLWVTGGSKSPNTGLVKGFTRAIGSENPNTRFVVFGIDDWTSSRNNLPKMIAKVFEHSFSDPSRQTEFDEELDEKDGVIYIPRVVRDTEMDESFNRETGENALTLQPFLQEIRPLKLTINDPGFLDTLCFVDDERAAEPILDDEIEIDIKASGLNFKDVILALGQLAGNHLGQECSGVVKRVGDKVSNVKCGDRVCAVIESAIANLGRCKAACATTLPQHMSYAEGASIPIIYCTAQYCLHDVVRLQPNETVLIHAGAGGVGQAAIMLAQAKGAKILTTVGSQVKKDFLMCTYGISEDCIFYSRDTSFVQGVMEATKGKGVDVALNSLAGDQLRATWECMAPFGRFVEIGKRDITSNMNLEMSRFERNVSFAAVDLTGLTHQRPHVLQDVLVHVMEMFKQNKVRPVAPIHEFAVSEVEAAFRAMGSGKLMGKLVIVPKPGDMVMAARSSTESDILRSDVSYLITGGTGGIGRAICQWMAHHGAKNIILASRSGLTQPNTKDMIGNLEKLGVKVEIRQCDVGNGDAVRYMVLECAEIMPPIGGVIHGAFVNRDILFEQANFSDWTAVIEPKVHGTWNLHEILLDHQLDFFIMLSSVSGIVGNRGQAAYAAASTFLDDFARYRASKGLPGTTIDLGVVSEIGFVAENPELQAGLEALTGANAHLTERDVLALIKLAIIGKIDDSANHQSTVGLSFEGLDPNNPATFWANKARFSHLRRTAVDSEQSANNAGPSVTPKQALKQATSLLEAMSIISEALIGKISSVLIIPAEEISTDKANIISGLDSLVAVEVRSWIAREFEAAITTMELMTSSSIGALADSIVGRSKLCERFGKEKGDGS